MSDHPPEFPEIEKEKPKTPGSPEEITRKLEDFIKNTLGGQVLFTRVEGPGARAIPHAARDRAAARTRGNAAVVAGGCVVRHRRNR